MTAEQLSAHLSETIRRADSALTLAQQIEFALADRTPETAWRCF